MGFGTASEAVVVVLETQNIARNLVAAPKSSQFVPNPCELLVCLKFLILYLHAWL